MITGLRSYPARGMPPELLQSELPMEDPEVLAQIKLGRTEASARRRDELHELWPLRGAKPSRGTGWL